MDIALASSAADYASDPDLNHLVHAAETLGHRAAIVVWDDPKVDWSRFERVAIRSCWDYTTRRDEFLNWCNSIGSSLINSSKIVEWNSDKHYLQDLAEEGISIIPTMWNVNTRSELGEHRSWVVKPTISAGSANTAHWTKADAALDHALELREAGHHTMTQPYVASIDTVGEFANYFFANHYSHSVKKPALLEPDRSPDIEASYPDGLRATDIDKAIKDFSERVLITAEKVIGHDIVQARVDVVLDDVGEPMLMELELIEPALFLDLAPAAAASYIAAITATSRISV